MTEETLKQDNPALDYEHRLEISDLAKQLRDVAQKCGMSSHKLSQSLKVHKTMEGPFTLLNDLDHDIDEATSILIGVYRQWGAMIEHFKSWLRPPHVVTEVKMMPDAHAEEMKICINEIVNIKKRILCEEEGVSNSDLNRAWEALFGLNDKLQDPQLEDLAVMQARQKKAPVVKDTEFRRAQMRQGLVGPSWLPAGASLGDHAAELPSVLRKCETFLKLFMSKAMTKKGLTFVCPECGALPGEPCIQNKAHPNGPSRVMKSLHYKRKTSVGEDLPEAPDHLEPWQETKVSVDIHWITPRHVTATAIALSLWDGEEQLTYQSVSSLARKLFHDASGVVAYNTNGEITHSRAFSLREWCGIRDRLIAHRKIRKMEYVPPFELTRSISENEITELEDWVIMSTRNDQVNDEREVAPVEASDTCALPPPQRPAPQ